MKRMTLLSLITAALTSPGIDAQVLMEWVETRTVMGNTQIALGYPTPIPVNTPLPFDGFRTFAGLHTRHQDLVASTPWVHPENIGLTRKGRTIWAYRLGDADRLTIDGLPEPATLTNGGIHAREWQSPEVVTGIMELLALHGEDHHFYDYLRDNVNMIVIPTLNIDGFLQTQDNPQFSYIMSDPNYPNTSPRDGRMRRKSMLSADEDFYTTVDHLFGVDLNRNNNPFWATNPNRSSPDMESLVHHGAAAASEPETQALDAAAQLGPIDQLRIYTDVHSFSLVHFWSRNSNNRLAYQTEQVLGLFSDHHVTFPAGKYYAFASRFNVPQNSGIGTTDEYFTHTYQVPSWTLEVEPSNGQSYHAPLPGGGADYGGVHENGHDGFILPDSEIRRVREELAQTFTSVFYRQAGPPAIQALRLIDKENGATVFEAAWDLVDSQTRSLYSKQLRPIQVNHSYDFWMSFNKPMRWRDQGEVVPFPGQLESTLDFEANVMVNGAELTTEIEAAAWLDQPDVAPDGYMNYQDDALKITLNFPEDENNLALITGEVQAGLEFMLMDMTGMAVDANPATVAGWSNGAWTRYEDANGVETDSGGWDKTITLQMTSDPVTEPFLLEPGITSSWFDKTHDGEGFLIELLSKEVAVMFWFTYDANGAQNWYVASGKVKGNRIDFPKLYSVTGGEFGPDFDPEKVVRQVVGSASFIWSGCDEGSMSYKLGAQHGRLQLTRLTNLMGLECGSPQMSPLPETALLSGSWFDRSHDGEGYIVEVLSDGRAVVFWFSFDTEGNPRWFYDAGEIIDGKLVFDNMLTTSGGIFGPEFDPLLVEQKPWGSLVLDLDCHGGTASYNSTEEGFGSGTLNVVRLTSIDQLACPQQQ